ncbi:MAG: DUF433 domain-containing protein [Nocardioidaceae bacterium]|jgi:uncharacterized protein (DUF433 family)|nr:DUF433 domain-containing protein [Nocardioidaceae bacterium]
MTGHEMQLISVHPDVLHGQAHVRGTRIPVALVLGCLAEGMSEQEIVREYPTLTVEGIRAAAAYAAELTREDVFPLPMS